MAIYLVGSLYVAEKKIRHLNDGSIFKYYISEIHPSACETGLYLFVIKKKGIFRSLVDIFW